MTTSIQFSGEDQSNKNRATIDAKQPAALKTFTPSQAVLATLDEFENTDVLEHTRELSKLYFEELAKLKETPVIAKVRGEGMVFGIECGPVGELSAEEVANEVVKAAYLGNGGDGIHLLGALAGKVIRISPPMVITAEEAKTSLELLQTICSQVAERLQGVTA